jgi:hypothetical protein
MSVPPTRPRFAASERNGRATPGRGLMTFALKTAWLAAIVFGVYYLMNQLKEPRGTVIVPNAQAPPATAGESRPASSLSLPPAPAPAPVSLENVELVTASSVQRQQLTAAKFKQRQTLTTFGEVTRALDEWEKELATWEKTGPPLLKSDEGKRIASDAALVKRFRVVLDLERPTREALAATRKQAEDLISPIREAELNPEDASAPADDLGKSLRELQTQARKARDSYRDARGAVEGLLAQAAAPRGGGAAGEKTLEQAIAQQSQEEALARAAIIEAEAKKAQAEGTQLVAAEKAKLVRVESELEAGRLRDQAEQKRQGLLRTGSVWKGSIQLTDILAPSTVTIARRVEDKIDGTVSWNEQGSIATLTFSGTVSGNAVKFKCDRVIRGNAIAGYTYNCVYDPFGRTLSGTSVKDGKVGATFVYRLSTGEE